MLHLTKKVEKPCTAQGVVLIVLWMTIDFLPAQVRKSYEEKRNRRKARGQKRPWRLKRMTMELEDDNAPSGPGRGREQRGAPGGTRREQDMERFMQVIALSLHALLEQHMQFSAVRSTPGRACEQRGGPRGICNEQDMEHFIKPSTWQSAL